MSAEPPRTLPAWAYRSAEFYAAERREIFARDWLLVGHVSRLRELSYVRDAGSSIAIGALTRHHDVASAPLLQEHNPLGVKGVGETGAIASPAAVMNAVVDALAVDGVVDIAMPATPERVWRALQEVQT